MIYKFGRRWAVKDGGVFNTKEEAYASIENGYSDQSDTAGDVPESTDTGVFGSPWSDTDRESDSGDQCSEQSEI